jgi:hypothetical protein
MSRREQDFQAIRSEGGLLPPDLLRRVIDPRANLAGTKSEDYGLPASERLNESITQSWNRLRRHWAEFRAAAAKLPEGEAGTGITNDKWSLPLLRELGFGLLPTSAGPEIGGRSYAINRFLGPVPIHLVGCGLSLDRRAAGQRGAAASNPHGLLQEFLNRSPGHIWGIVSNGRRLRILRDNQALSRQSFIEFDLEAMFTGEIYADFVLIWLVTHATRFAPREGLQPETCWLEIWTKETEEQGTRALKDLRGSVERALQVLGEGFTSHPRNIALRQALRDGELSPTDFHGQLLRVVYRLIFLFVAEDRVLENIPLLHPRDNSDAARVARERYAAHYSTARLRDLAGLIKGSRHGDLWRQFQLLVSALSGESVGEPIRRHLALPALGSFLWAAASTSILNDAELTNFDLLEALRHLAFTRQGKVLRPVDYKNLGSEELGGVYESLLTLTPQISADGARFNFAEFAGNERKTSGSYYTPDSLVQCLLDSALDPVVEVAIIGKTGSEAERAILALKVCDPAVGSGHFLVGAAHRLARHLARVRALAQGESEPSPLLYQHALRDIIGRCLYGVDMSPMAAELCRVGLWLEALEPGKPLSFLDHHIRVGNSLLGATSDLIAAGLPDETFTAIEGDDKKACAILKKRNKAERRGLGPLFAQQDAETQTRLQRAAATLQELPDDRPEDIRAKELAFRRHEKTDEYRNKKRLADTWCAAFVMRKYFRDLGRETSVIGITQTHLNDLAGDRPLPADIIVEVDRLSSQYQFFHWHLAFPEVRAKGGFDCVLGNPPWERVNLEAKQFFATARPDIAEATTSKRRELLKRLASEQPELMREYQDAQRRAATEIAFFQNSGAYPHLNQARLNTYALFTELSAKLSGDRGRCGIIVPSGVATDDISKNLFEFLIKSGRLTSLFDFENREELFVGVHRSYKFCLLTLSGRHDVQEARLAFSLYKPEDLQDENRTFSLTADEFQLLSPITGLCPTFRCKRDRDIVIAIYKRVKPLIRQQEEKSDWVQSDFLIMFRSDDSDYLYRTTTELEVSEPTPTSLPRLQSKEAIYVPVWESKLLHQFDHRFASFAGVAETERKKGNCRELSSAEKPGAWIALPRHWAPLDAVNESLTSRGWRRSWTLGYRDITNATNERTAIASCLPEGGAAQPLNLFLPQSGAHGIFWLACMNSMILDYVARQRIGGVHLNITTCRQLPIIGPVSVPVDAAQFVRARVLELVFTSPAMEFFAQDNGWSGPPFRWDDERRFLLRCELDAAFFHFYLRAEKSGAWFQAVSETANDLARLKASFPSPRDAIPYILDTFPIVCRKDEEKFDGDYRTKRVILEIYDAMQESFRTGQPYKTRLDPAPGPPCDANGKFIDYAEIAANPPPHMHLPEGHAKNGAELHISDLARSFPNAQFIVRLGTQPRARRIRVTPVSTADLVIGEQVILAAAALRLHGEGIPAAIGKLGIESRSDASSGKHYLIVSVRGDRGVAQARFSEPEWKNLTSVGRIEDLV